MATLFLCLGLGLCLVLCLGPEESEIHYSKLTKCSGLADFLDWLTPWTFTVSHPGQRVGKQPSVIGVHIVVPT